MTLDKLRPVAKVTLRPGVRLADALGISPHAISVVAFACAIAAGVSFALGARAHLWYLVGAAFVFANGWFDLLDGALAREQGVSSPAGDVLDHVLDRYADIVVIGGLAVGIDAFVIGFAAVTGVLMTSYLGTQAIAVGLDRVYGGLVGRADRLAIIGIVSVVFTFYPNPIAGWTLIAWLLVLLAVVGHLTAVQRFFGTLRTVE